MTENIVAPLSQYIFQTQKDIRFRNTFFLACDLDLLYDLIDHIAVVIFKSQLFRMDNPPPMSIALQIRDRFFQFTMVFNTF